MGLKLEIFIIAAIALILSITYFFKISNSDFVQSAHDKQLEFKNTTLIEVDTEKMLSNIVSKYGVRRNSTLSLEEIVFHSKNINSLEADSAQYSHGIMHLEGNITLQQKEGFLYRAKEATYDTKKEILNVPSDFTAKISKNIIEGNNLTYNAKTKIAESKNINATVYTTEK